MLTEAADKPFLLKHTPMCHNYVTLKQTDLFKRQRHGSHVAATNNKCFVEYTNKVTMTSHTNRILQKSQT
jgi:hypothetical protein